MEQAVLKFGYRKEYNIWLLLYVASNILASVISYSTGYLMGDMDGTKVYDNGVLFIACAIEVLSYIFVLRVVFDFIFRIKFNQIFHVVETAKSRQLGGGIVLILQLLLIIVSLAFGVNTAGSSARSDSLWSLFWIFVPVDMIFLVYYGFRREDKLFKHNLIIYILSSLIRGWSGIFLYIFFFEWCRAYRKKTIQYKKVAFIVIIVIALYPALLSLKWIMRASDGDLASLENIMNIFSAYSGELNYIEVLLQGITHLIGRLQHSSVIVEMIHYKELIQEGFGQGTILPFWGEGLPQLAFRRLFGLASPVSAGTALTGYFFPQDISETAGFWNICIGFSGWFYIAPHLIWFYLFYVFFLLFASAYFIKQIGKEEGGSDVLWLAWISFIMQGWIMAFIGFIYAVIWFIIIQKVAKKISRVNFSLKQTEPFTQTN